MHSDILHLLKEELENTLIRHKLKGIRELQTLHDMEAHEEHAESERPKKTVLTT
jgi:predicted nuclease with TOPRIM domain